MQFRRDDVFPDSVDGRDIVFVTGQRGHVGHARIHVRSANGVADRFVLFEDRLVVLVVLAAESPPVELLASNVEKELGQIEILLVARRSVEPCQAHFDDLVPGRFAELVGPEDRREIVGVLDRDIEERPLAGRLVMGNGRFVHVARVVEFVAMVEFLPTLVAKPLFQVLRVVGSACVEIAVVLLGPGDRGDQIVDVLVQLGVGFHGQGIRGAFGDLVRIGVVEREPSTMFSLDQPGGELEVIHPAVLLALAEGVGDRDLAIRFDARGPEWPGQFDVGKRHRPHGIVVR